MSANAFPLSLFTFSFIIRILAANTAWVLAKKCLIWAFLVAQQVKNLPAMRETWVRSMGWENPLEKLMATHSSILAWRVPMDRGACQAIVMGSQRIGHN